MPAHSSLTDPSPCGYKNLSACTTPIDLKVIGHIPEWVHGVLYRAGVGTYTIPKPDGSAFHFNHPFDGLAMLHRFEIHGGNNPRVSYTSRHTANGVKSRIIRDDSTLVFFGPDPCKTIFGRIQSVYHQLLDFGRDEIAKRMQTDPEGENINVAIGPNFPLGEDLEREWGVDAGMALVVKTDANMLQLIDSKTLEPKKIFTYATVDKEYSGQLTCSHHQYDMKTGEWFNFILEVFPKPTYRVFSYSTPTLPGPTKVKKFQPITQNLSLPSNYILPTRQLKPCYTHSFAITDNYVIIPNWSYYFPYLCLGVLWYGNVYESLYFDPSLPTLFHVLSRESGEHVATYECESAFAFHTANAWDDNNGTIWMDICTYPDTRIIDASFDFARMHDEKYVKSASYKQIGARLTDANLPIPELRRYKLSDVPSTPSNTPRRASYTVLGLDIDLPGFDPRRQCKPYRYLYGGSPNPNRPKNRKNTDMIFSIQKMDLGPPSTSPVSTTEQVESNLPVDKKKGSGPNTRRFDPPSGSCSEPIFLPNPSGTVEDDGIVLTVVNEIHGDEQETCVLVVLDAKTMTEMARAEIGPWHVTTVHGSFVNETGKGINVS